MVLINVFNPFFSVLRMNEAEPSFTDRPRDQTAYEEATVEMGCSADGYPSPGLVWTKNGAPLTPDARTAIGLTRIRIERVRLSDQGRYKCTLTNQVPATSSFIKENSLLNQIC